MWLQDPEGILASPRGGHLRRREAAKQMLVDKDLQEQADRAREEARHELMRKREVICALHPARVLLRPAVLS